ncbi:cation:proton antiporter [Candidatus Micrarchaeota archaeon]|nr:cation:proton antiporter [Candidatus Micrarchaeota archaeon]
MVEVASIPFIQIGVIILSSLLFGIIFSKLGFSSAVGYIIAGLLLGPLGLNYLASQGLGIGVASVFGEIGVMMLLFYLGLELNIKRFKETGAIATILASVEMLFAFVAGFFVAKYFGFSDLESIVIGAMLTATSTVITSKFIIERKLIESAESRIVISVLILEDFLAILILVFISSLAEHASLNILVLNAVFFVIAMFFLVSKVSKHVLNLLSAIGYEDQMWLYAIGVFITVAFFGSTFLGLSPALGAYFAGFALAESAYGAKIKKELGLFREFFVLFFFVSFGATATMPGNPQTYLMLLVLVAGYVMAKLLSEVIFGSAVGLDMKSAVSSGLLMGSVGEFSLIIAATAAPILPNGAEVLSLAFLLTLVTTTTMPILFDRRDKIATFFEKIYPLKIREKTQFVKREINAIEKLTKDVKFQNEYLVSVGKLFKNLVIAISIIYLSYLVNVDINLPFAPAIPSKLSLSVLVLPLIIWPIYKSINELKFLAKRVANFLLITSFPTKDKNVLAIEKEVGDVFSGIILVLIGFGSTAFLYSHYPEEFLFLAIPATYTVLAIMYLSKSFYGLIEQYESLEETLGEGIGEIADDAIARLSKEFNEHAKLLRDLQNQRIEAKEKIVDAMRTNNINLAKQVLFQFKRQENKALVNVLKIGDLAKYPRLQGMLESDVARTAQIGKKITEISSKEAFVNYMKEHLKPQLYEQEFSKGNAKGAMGKGRKKK